MKRRILFAIIFVVLGLTLTAIAQEPESSSPAPAQTQAEPQHSPETAPAEAPAHEQHGSEATTDEKHEGLAKEESEAEENASLKYSPAVTAIGKKFGLSPKTSYWTFTGLNFAVLVVLIGWAMKKLVLTGMRTRNESIRSAMDTARKASEDANTRLAAIEDRLSKLDSEVSQLKAQAESDFKAEEQRIQQAATEDAQRVVQAAEQEIAATVKSARRELKSFVADLAVDLAEKKITVDRDTDEHLVRSFVSELGKERE